ncbi:MAG TPA: pyruvate kinase alpha/beta domain-containing protein [Planctomycetota bacterium]|nr:pyruvate kinase alpha/beta domain-containing protein [Planctomycetota bacterium]
MKRKTVVYLDKPGRKGCPACLEAAAERAAELGVRHVVVATSSGRTGLEMARALRAAGSRAAVVGVGYAANFAAKWGRLEKRFTAPAEKLGAVFIAGTHALGGVNGAVRDRFGGCATPGNLIAGAYYTFGQGMKVAVEVALMAADQGAVPTDREILALGGTAEGADTAVVLSPACSQDFFKLRVHEVVCMPR